MPPTHTRLSSTPPAWICCSSRWFPWHSDSPNSSRRQDQEGKRLLTRMSRGKLRFEGWTRWDIELGKGWWRGTRTQSAKMQFYGCSLCKVQRGAMLTLGNIFADRFSRDRPRFTDTLDVIKFLCKDMWTLLFKKQIDNLKTNHRVQNMDL